MPQHQQAATFIPQSPPAQQLAQRVAPQATASRRRRIPSSRMTPVPRRHAAKTKPPPRWRARRAPRSATRRASGAQSAIVRLGLAPQVSAHLGRLVDRVVPPEFHIDAAERRVLNALGETGDAVRAQRSAAARRRRRGHVHGGADAQARDVRPRRPGRAGRAAGWRADLPADALIGSPTAGAVVTSACHAGSHRRRLARREEDVRRDPVGDGQPEAG